MGAYVSDHLTWKRLKRTSTEIHTIHDLPKYDFIAATIKSITARKKSSKLPARNNDTTRPWEQTGPRTVWEKQPIERHPIDEIQQLEQAAKRLVAKAKEMIEPNETNKREFAVDRKELSLEQKKNIE